MEILGEAAAGKSAGDAMKNVNLVAKPAAWLPSTGLSYQEALSSEQSSRAICHFTGRGVPRPRRTL
ncbi:hypothetical protein ACNKHM_13975 [Shigella sonnei]